jgi:hypothetical protein
MSCGNQPKIVEASNKQSTESSGKSSGIFSTNDNDTKEIAATSGDIHEVTVLDVLPTEKYIYLEVEEKNEKFWIATKKQEVKKGERYFFKGGLLKTNFESKEYNRTFDKVYLVSNLVPMDHGHGAPASDVENSVVESIKSIDPKEGSIKISEIIDNPDKYKGKTVQVTGQCVKVNPNIMGRNWIHLKDGSKDGYDFVLTSGSMVPEGQIVTLSGIVSLDKDFGAGYRYEIIVEEANIVK